MSEDTDKKMANDNPTSPDAGYLTRKIQENPLATIALGLILTVATSITASIGTTKNVAASEVQAVTPAAIRAAGENIFATKDQNADIWRHMEEKSVTRDKQMDKFEQNMMTKEQFQQFQSQLFQRLDRMENKIDERPPRGQ